MTIYSISPANIMDWSYDNARLTECDLDTVFQYGPRDSTVVEMLGEKDVSLIA